MFKNIWGNFENNKILIIMIVQIPDLPNNMVGFRADGEVTKDDFEVVKHQVATLVEKTGKLNYLLFLDNSPSSNQALAMGVHTCSICALSV